MSINTIPHHNPARAPSVNFHTPPTRIPSKPSRAATIEELKQWGNSFQLKTPIPADIVPILARDEVKQIEIQMKNVRLERDVKGGS